MRLAINGWFLGQQATGSGQYLHHLLDHLPRQRAGIQITVLTPSSQHDPAWQARWPDIRIAAVESPALPRALRKIWWEQIGFPRAARKHAPDVLWVPYWAAPLRASAPVVVTVHDVIPLILSAYQGAPQHQLYTRLVAYTARRAAAILTVSHASADDIVRRLQIAPHCVHVVYHGPNVPTEPIKQDTLARVRDKYALPDRYFLYLGGFDVRKNVDSVVRAYQRYLEMGGSRDVQLVLAGRLPDSVGRVVADPRHIVSEMGLDTQVCFCGWVEETDKPALYARATAFVFPSLYEGFGMMALEAMAAGTPVITSER